MQVLAQLLPLALMVTLYVGVVIFILVMIWRGVRAHERIASALERLVAEKESARGNTVGEETKEDTGDHAERRRVTGDALYSLWFDPDDGGPGLPRPADLSGGRRLAVDESP